MMIRSHQLTGYLICTLLCRELVRSVKYAETEFADSVFELVRGGFLSATSTSWQPLEFERMDSGNGLILTSVDLLEISQVNVSELPTALLKAAGRGLNLAPIREWASRALDTNTPRIPRHDVEAIYRSISAAVTRLQRRHLALAIVARVRAEETEDRRAHARAIRARILREDTPRHRAGFATSTAPVRATTVSWSAESQGRARHQLLPRRTGRRCPKQSVSACNWSKTPRPPLVLEPSIPM
jgi:hypothetical protein